MVNYEHQVNTDLTPQYITRLRDEFNYALKELSLPKHPTYLYEPISYVFSGKGKRLRPILLYITGDSLGATHKDLKYAGIAVELLHNFTLVHDDIMDQDDLRHGQHTIHKKWDESTAILAGDFLLARASGIAASLGTEVAELLAGTIGELCEGQILELQSTFKLDRNESSYERSISGKTASLLATACRIGGLTADLSRDNIDILTSFGHSYGMAFQIVDDILDLVSTDEQLGKPSGNDLMEGVYTLPVIFAFASNNGEELKELLGKEISVEERDHARNLIRASGGVSEALSRARLWTDKASAALNDLPPSESTEALGAATTHLIQRVATPVIN